LNRSTIVQLVFEDLRNVKLPTLLFLGVGVVSLVTVVVFEYFLVPWADNLLLTNVIGVLALSGMAGGGLVALLNSTPGLGREQALAKLIARFTLFAGVWLMLLIGVLAVFFGEHGFAKGSAPMVSIILTGVLLAYTVILGVNVMTASKRYTIVALVVAIACTSLYLNLFGQSYFVSAFSGGSQIIWYSGALDILLTQLACVVVFLFATIAGSIWMKAPNLGES